MFLQYHGIKMWDYMIEVYVSFLKRRYAITSMHHTCNPDFQTGQPRQTCSVICLLIDECYAGRRHSTFSSPPYYKHLEQLGSKAGGIYSGGSLSVLAGDLA